MMANRWDFFKDTKLLLLITGGAALYDLRWQQKLMFRGCRS